MRIFDAFPTPESDKESYQRLEEMADEIYNNLPDLYQKCIEYVELSSSHRENVEDVKVYCFREVLDGEAKNNYILYVTYTDNDIHYSQIISLSTKLHQVRHFTQYHWDAIQTIADKYGFGYEVGGE